MNNPEGEWCGGCACYEPETESCRRYPPTLVDISGSLMEGGRFRVQAWPEVKPDWWCAEFRPHEEKQRG